VSADYLWDGSGEPDPEIVRLEQLLRPLGHDTRALSTRSARWGEAVASMRTVSRRVPQRMLLALVAAAVIVIAVGVAWQRSTRPVSPTLAWTVGRLEGTPTIESKPMADRANLREGGALDTGSGSRARIDIANIGELDVDSGSRVELVRARGAQYRLRLHWGTVHARIVAPPGQFVVETPSSTVTDLGCAYTLQVDEEGVGSVHVTSGWVGFEWHGRESFIPAGAMCATRPGVGPGTPHRQDAPDVFRAALGTFDFGAAGARTSALDRVLAAARVEDAVTLWHLLTRVDGEQRARVFDRLAAFVPPPAGVTREGVVGADQSQIDRWWDELGFGSIIEWRHWKQRWSETSVRR